MGIRLCVKVFSCLMLALLLATAGPVQAETIVNNTDIGTEASPFEGDGIAVGTPIPDTDDYNDITNNADIYVKWLSDTDGERGYGIFNYSGIVRNYGTIFSLDGNAVRFGDYTPGMYPSPTGYSDTLYNFGTISTETGVAVHMGKGDDRLENSGTISAESAGNGVIVMGPGNDTVINYASGIIDVGTGRTIISFAEGDDTLENAGTISIEWADYAGMSFATGNDTLINSGTIDIKEVNYGGISFAAGNDRLENSGTISIGVCNYSAISFGSNDDTLVNSGTISIESANCSGISMGSGKDTVTNSGTIAIDYAGEAGIAWGGGNDTLTNTGTLTIGTTDRAGMSFACGNDTLDNSGTLTIENAGNGGSYGCGISFASGNDTLINSGVLTIGSAYCSGISMATGADTINNTGTLTINYAGEAGISWGGGNDTLINVGTLNIAEANYAGMSFACGNDTLDNSGTLAIRNAGDSGISFASGSDTLINSGTLDIGSACCSGISMATGADTIDNTGTLTIGYAGEAAISMGGGDDTINNSGTIDIGVGNKVGIAWGCGDNTLNNSGTLSIGYTGNNAISFGSNDDTLMNSGVLNIGTTNCNGISFATGNDVFDNSGTVVIGSANQPAINMAGGDDSFTNTGTVTIGRSGETAITMGCDSDTFDNSGTISIGQANYSGISLGDDGDDFTNTGTITIDYAGDAGVSLGSGDDTFMNSGTITVGNAEYPGITMGWGEDYLENSGTIDIGFALNGVMMGCGDTVPNTLINSGTINVEHASNIGVGFGSGDDTLENSGTINIGFAGNWGIVMGSGYDTLTNSGIIVGSIDMGSEDDVVTLGSTASASSNVGDIEGSYGDDELNLVGAGSVDGDIWAFERVSKTGAGVFSLNGDAEVEDTATISGGTLLVNGDMGPHTAGPLAVTIGPEGTLGGTGTIMGDVVNDGGTVAPGASIGTLTIEADEFAAANGDYTQFGPTAKFALEVNRTGADRLDVEGTATLHGGTATVTPIGVTMDGDTHTVLTAGTLTGDGVPDGDVVQTSPVLSFEFNSDTDSTPHAITMTTHRTPYMDLVLGSNQRSIAANLFASLGDASGDWEQFLVLLDTLPTTDALGDALDEISPEPYANFGDMSRASINLYMKAIMDRLGGLRDMAELSSAQQYASNILTGSGPVLADVPAPDADAWSLWASGFGQWAEQDSESGNFGFEYESSGMALGIDRALTDTVAVGLSAGFAKNDVEFDEVSAETDIDTWHVGVYGTYTTDLFYVDASVSYADNEYDSERDISLVGLTAESDHDGRDYSVYVGGGYNMSLGGFKVIPTASVQYIDHKEDSFTETGAGVLNLEVDDIDSESVVGAIGVRVARMFEMGGIRLLPEVSARWAHEFGDTEDTVKARFAGSTAGTFSVDSIDADADSALLGASVTAYVTDSISLFLDYDAELRSDFDAHNVSGGLKYSF